MCAGNAILGNMAQDKNVKDKMQSAKCKEQNEFTFLHFAILPFDREE